MSLTLSETPKTGFLATRLYAQICVLSVFFQVAPEAWELLTYIPSYGEKFEYSHSHFLYTNDIQRLEDIPPPHTAPTRKQEIFDVDAYSYVDERTDAVSSLYIITDNAQVRESVLCWRGGWGGDGVGVVVVFGVFCVFFVFFFFLIFFFFFFFFLGGGGGG